MLGRKFYIHTKTGNKYELLCIGEHSETHESMAVYKQVPNKEGDTVSSIIWIRPYNMFNEMIEVNGKYIRRYSPID